MEMLFQSETITNHMLFNVYSFLSSAKEHLTFGLYGELWILLLKLSVKDMEIVIQVENFAPLVTVWWNTPLWECFVLLWTKKEDSGISKDSCCEHLQPSYTLFVSPFPVCLF